MLGNEIRRVVLQPRDILILQEVAALRVVDREQIKVVAGFGSTNRVNARLLALVRAGCLKRFYLNAGLGAQKALYAVTAHGAAIANAPFRRVRRQQEEPIAFDLMLEHQLRANWIYIAAKYQPIPLPHARFSRWIFINERLAPAVPIVPDGCFEVETGQGPKLMFLEVDMGTETSRIWQRKISAYLSYATSNVFPQRFNHSQFRVLVVGTSDRRLQMIRRTILRSTSKIFWLTTFENIKHEGLWSPIWLRPSGDERQALS